jgi:hypothetical protein
MEMAFISKTEKPLFTLSSISIREYGWAQKSLGEKSIIIVMNMIFLIGFLLIATRSYEPSWSSLWHLLRGSLIFLLFPLIVFPALILWRKRYPANNQHLFFTADVRVYTGCGKRGYSWVRANAMEGINLEQKTFRDQRFYLVTVLFKRLKPRFLGRPKAVKFGIDGAENLTELFDWAHTHDIKVSDCRTDPSTSSG